MRSARRSFRFLIYSLCLLSLASHDAIGGVQATSLDFATTEQSIWGSGAGSNLDKTWSDFLFDFSASGTAGGTVLGSGVTLPYSYNGTVGLEPRLRISSGSVDVTYPFCSMRMFPIWLSKTPHS